ncbi:MAG: biotin/lipoate A/B protein ligase family protein [Nanoarchaeota archaeon]
MNYLRVISPGFDTGARHMAWDEAILNHVNTNQSPPTLRLYYFNPPAVTLSSECHLDIINKTTCTQQQIDIIRRPTGGSALFHNRKDLAYSFIAPIYLFEEQKPVKIMRNICNQIASAFTTIGIPAYLNQKSNTNILIDGKKISGSASMIKTNAILVHGSIFHNIDTILISSLINIPQQDLENRMIGISTYTNNHAEIHNAIINALSYKLEIRINETATESEHHDMHRILQDKFSTTSEWLTAGKKHKKYCGSSIE